MVLMIFYLRHKDLSGFSPQNMQTKEISLTRQLGGAVQNGSQSRSMQRKKLETSWAKPRGWAGISPKVFAQSFLISYDLHKNISSWWRLSQREYKILQSNAHHKTTLILKYKHTGFLTATIHCFFSATIWYHVTKKRTETTQMLNLRRQYNSAMTSVWGLFMTFTMSVFALIGPKPVLPILKGFSL